MGRGVSYYETGDTAHALEDLNTALEKGIAWGDETWGYYWRGLIYIKAGQREKGIADLQKAVQLDSSNNDARQRLKELGVPGY